MLNMAAKISGSATALIAFGAQRTNHTSVSDSCLQRHARLPRSNYGWNKRRDSRPVAPALEPETASVPRCKRCDRPCSLFETRFPRFEVFFVFCGRIRRSFPSPSPSSLHRVWVPGADAKLFCMISSGSMPARTTLTEARGSHLIGNATGCPAPGSDRASMNFTHAFPN